MSASNRDQLGSPQAHGPSRSYQTPSIRDTRVDRVFLGHVRNIDGSSNIKDEKEPPLSLITVSANNRGEGLLVATNAFEISPRSDAIRAQRAAELNRDTIMAEAKQKADRLRALKRPLNRLNKHSILPHLDDEARQKMIEEAEVECNAAKTAIAPALRALERTKEALKRAETLDCIQTEYLQIEYVLLHEFKVCQQELPDLRPMDFLLLHDHFWEWQLKRLKYFRLLDRRDKAFGEWVPMPELEGRSDQVVTKLRSPEAVRAQMIKRLAEHGIKKEEKGDDEIAHTENAVDDSAGPTQSRPTSTQDKAGKVRGRKDSLIDIVGLSDSDEDEDEGPIRRTRKRRRNEDEPRHEFGPSSSKCRRSPEVVVIAN